jgi:hypothetical protein
MWIFADARLIGLATRCAGTAFLKHVIDRKIEGRIEVTGRRRRRRKQLLNDVKEMRQCLKLKEEALDRTLGRTRFGLRYGPVKRQAME